MQMKSEPPFDLNRSIQHWRDALAQSPAIHQENLGELETHLRDSVDALASRGLTTEEAFLIASRRVGRTDDLGREFEKVNTGKVWQSRLLWVVVGMLVSMLWADLQGAAYWVTLYLGSWATDNSAMLTLSVISAEYVVMGLGLVLLPLLLMGNGRVFNMLPSVFVRRPGLGLLSLAGMIMGIHWAVQGLMWAVAMTHPARTLIAVLTNLRLAGEFHFLFLVLALTGMMWWLLRCKSPYAGVKS